MTYDEGRKPENVPWTEMPAPNGNARQNNRTQVVSHKAAIGLRPCKGLVVVPADMGGGAVIEYHHQHFYLKIEIKSNLRYIHKKVSIYKRNSYLC